MSPTILFTRLALAVAVPVVLVTATLSLIFQAHLEARLEAAQAGAKAMLEAGHASLTRGMNESLNHALATAELPSLKRYLTRPGKTQPSYQATTTPLPMSRCLRCSRPC
ncbi:hypothetical protein [Halomonas nitroreducens]|uniref:hypothetical protein n=1 Tax=Halomonas nitroreducens TaxID=447425 RepID=UPI001FE377E8|nr:hypothetical protein [Halomonas nitroreducens]